MNSTFDAALQLMLEPPQLPHPMPPIHVTTADAFEHIVTDGCLKPQRNDDFDSKLLFLYYGAAYYRPSTNVTRKKTCLPIAFLFHPRTLRNIDCYYPCDTGALANGIFDDWVIKFEPFREILRVSGGDWRAPCRIVHHVFRDNENYLVGNPDPGCGSKPDPIPDLLAFYRDENVTYRNAADDRQIAIECHSMNEFPLEDTLLWVGFPDSMGDIYGRLCEKTLPHIPKPFVYRAHAIFNPAEITYELRSEARKFMSEYVQTLYAKTPV